MNDYKWNEYQTSYEDLRLDSYPEEIQEQFKEFIATVPYIQWMISKDRPRAKDLPRDDKGRIIVDIAHPHILEDMDYFRPAILHYLKYGKYCDYTPNANPNSPYMKWLIEETRRCWYGYVRPEDGEWVTGDMYFFLNYCPMSLTSSSKSGKRAKRVMGFPRVWEGHYLKFHYLEQARNNGHHASELASRGKGKSICGASLLAKRFILGEDAEVDEKVISYITASDKKYLVANGDQTLDKFEYIINYIAQRTELQWPKQRLISSINSMQWQMGYKEITTGTKKGTLNSTIGVSSKDDEGKLRGSRGVLYIFEEFGSFPRLSELYSNVRFSVEEGNSVYGLLYSYGCVCAGTTVFDLNGKPFKIEDIQVNDNILGYNGSETSNEKITYTTPIAYKECLRIYTSKNNYIDCSIDHPLLTLEDGNKTAAFYRAEELKVGNLLLIPRKIGKFGNIHIPWDTGYLLGALFGDGNYGGNQCVTLSISSEEEYEYYNTHFDIGISKIRDSSSGIYAQLYFRGLHPLLKEHGMDKQAFDKKVLPDKIFEWDEESVAAFLSGYFNADGNVQIVKKKHRSIKLTCKYRDTLENIKWLLAKFGIAAHIYEENKPGRILHSVVNNRDYNMNPTVAYVLYISNSEDIIIFRNKFKFLLKYKQNRLDSFIPTRGVRRYDRLLFRLRDNKKGEYFNGKYISDVYGVRIKKIEYRGVQRIYNLTADTTHTYITNGFISSNTSGDSQSDFQSAQEMVDNPQGYNMQPVENVYDKSGQGRKYFTYFFPGYINRDNCYNENGVSDVTKALLEILVDRYNVKHNSTKISTITKRIAEYPVTPREAMLKTAKNMFPVAELNERLGQLLEDPHIQDNVYVGTLVYDKYGKVSFVPTSDEPITEFPLQDNKDTGALQLFSLPETDSEGNVFNNRYIIGVDPIDNDESSTLSLYSIFVLDLWTDMIAAEYTGRYPAADDCHEIVRKLCIYYNAKALYENNLKGLYAYFLRMHCTYLLADTPEYLRDKDIIKTIGIGNRSKGVAAIVAVNNYANQLIKEWLIKPIVIIDKDENGNEYERTISNLYRIKNIALIRELIAFNPEINVDRVRALGMVMLYREEKIIACGGELKKSDDSSSETYLGNDDFFKRNYDDRFRLYKQQIPESK